MRRIVSRGSLPGFRFGEGPHDVFHLSASRFSPNVACQKANRPPMNVISRCLVIKIQHWLGYAT